MSSDDQSSHEVTPGTVLVVEPDILVRMSIAAYLRDCGYKVIEGGTADDVLAVLESGQKIDVVFAEVELSGGLGRRARRARFASTPSGARPRSMGGFGLAQWLRENHPEIDVILTSGIDRAAERAGDLCDEGSLEKPYHPEEVVRRINILRERRRMTRKT
jgi:DNA-binding response OmpR family regulator